MLKLNESICGTFEVKSSILNEVEINKASRIICTIVSTSRIFSVIRKKFGCKLKDFLFFTV